MIYLYIVCTLSLLVSLAGVLFALAAYSKAGAALVLAHHISGGIVWIQQVLLGASVQNQEAAALKAATDGKEPN